MHDAYLKAPVPIPIMIRPTMKAAIALLGLVMTFGEAEETRTRWPTREKPMPAKMVLKRPQCASARYAPKRGITYAQKELTS